MGTRVLSITGILFLQFGAIVFGNTVFGEMPTTITKVMPFWDRRLFLRGYHTWFSKPAAPGSKKNKARRAGYTAYSVRRNKGPEWQQGSDHSRIGAAVAGWITKDFSFFFTWLWALVLVLVFGFLLWFFFSLRSLYLIISQLKIKGKNHQKIVF